MEKLLVNTRKKRVLTLLITDIKVKKDLARTHKRRIRLLSFTQENIELLTSNSHNIHITCLRLYPYQVRLQELCLSL